MFEIFFQIFTLQIFLRISLAFRLQNHRNLQHLQFWKFLVSCHLLLLRVSWLLLDVFVLPLSRKIDFEKFSFSKIRVFYRKSYLGSFCSFLGSNFVSPLVEFFFGLIFFSHGAAKTFTLIFTASDTTEKRLFFERNFYEFTDKCESRQNRHQR